MIKNRKTICIDFDGVLSSYDQGFQGRGKFGKIIPGAAAGIARLKGAGWKIIIFTTRGEEAEIRKFLHENQVPFDDINKNSEQLPGTNPGKPFAHVYLDDRALTFKGNWLNTVREVLEFRPWQGPRY